MIRHSHDDLMADYSRFILQEGGEKAELLDQREPLNRYYGAAFEMIAIGAMHLTK